MSEGTVVFEVVDRHLKLEEQVKVLGEKLERLEKAIFFHAGVLDKILEGGTHDHFGTHL